MRSTCNFISKYAYKLYKALNFVELGLLETKASMYAVGWTPRNQRFYYYIVHVETRTFTLVRLAENGTYNYVG